MTDAELQAIEERANNATPGPWQWYEPLSPDEEDASFMADAIYRKGYNPNDEEESAVLYVDFTDGEDQSSGFLAMSVEDADFLIHAREDVPALVARVRELQSALRDAELCGVRKGLEAAAQVIQKEIVRPEDCLHYPDREIAEKMNGEADWLESLIRDIRAIDPASVLTVTAQESSTPERL